MFPATSRRFVQAVSLVTVLLSLSACSTQKEKPKAKPPVPVAVATAARKDVPVQLKAIGNIEPFNSVAIKSQVNGQIAKVHFQDGCDVQKGALLVTLQPESFQAALNQSEAALTRDLAQAKFAKEQAERYRQLVAEGIVTKDQYDQLRTNAESAAAAVAADRAAIANAKIQRNYCYIRSPISGRTGNLALQLGNLVKANDLTLVTINQISPIYATFSIPEKSLPEVKKAMAGRALKIEAVVPNDPNGKETGTISFLDNAVNSATGTIRLKGVFANADRKLWPGQFVDVVMTLGVRRDAVVVPTQAVQVGQQGQYVYVVKPDKTAEMRSVTVAAEQAGESVIEKGVAPGETVVVSGQLRLTPGAKVELPSSQPTAVKRP
ncbi:efflux pump, RND family, membrane fusion lipoprotein [Citrifermentans bemidjiense Bem]|uniref:Efflux pump, RND family, membrane fusion lipoprotein n=1 Tax=Citrifermentans bemidjiense (strain ATCC BAA-1014 / DSM 16622 / JCM 12645 / Bem) TaxID=404380 RepID=B5E8B2_CITBB|nr:efflux RND transporter periplasmic adaptor subunit [Citrifermentans bemidjiense]ACH37095.1 efflux pump, RND family, membrane fusion lipoprotein [Citrifermentans bemidjiense Bem]